MVNPLFLLAPLAVKKLALLKAADAYGYPRLYRRIILPSVKMFVPAKDQIVVKNSIKQAIRFPLMAYQLFLSQPVISYIKEFSVSLVENRGIGGMKVPEFVFDAAKILVARTPLGQILELLEKASKKK